MGWIRQRLAEQAFGRSGITQPREHKIDRGAGGIDGAVEVAPATLDTNVGLIDTPGLRRGRSNRMLIAVSREAVDAALDQIDLACPPIALWGLSTF